MTIDRSLVQTLPLFAGLVLAELDHMLSLAASRRYAAGAPVFVQGEPAEHFFVLLH